MKNRIIRVAVCLLLICCILVNLSPLKAHALDPVTVGFVGVSAVVGVACIMQALGYMAASNSEPFTNSVNQCVNYLTESTSFVTNGLLTFAGYRSGQLSSMYAMRDLVQEVWQWLFDTNSVSYSNPAFSTMTSFVQSRYDYITSNYNYGFCWYYDTKWYFAYSDYPLTIGDLSNGTRVCVRDDGLNLYSFYANTTENSSSVIETTSSAIVQSSSWFKLGKLSDKELYAVDGIQLGQIQSPYQTVGTDEEIIEIEIAPVYIDLTKEIQEFPDPNNPSDDPDLDKKIPWLPIRIPSKNYDDTVINQTQQESWTGESDVEFEFDYGDSSGDGSGDTGSTNTASGILSWLQNFFKVEPGDLKFDIDWSGFFPFCIPRDILDFVKALQAEPEAPHFVFDLDFPYMDEPWHIDIDFSVWDPVALVLRRLELLLFVVGLAMATRNFYIRG